ncbi:hypothetical protein BDQ12DRAFT_461635 [Crucibulum laeve]|uniref:Pentacotripeptide-repeat region of PRORP domain-containing protein n=1 Tax=Crucibulum laeve TaxID=68775 RepID=A0A5C3M7I2_9AGAR|nr:hypothetical protein BDQ12DRAFT_461635 [Crucibulum laeve]
MFVCRRLRLLVHIPISLPHARYARRNSLATLRAQITSSTRLGQVEPIAPAFDQLSVEELRSKLYGNPTSAENSREVSNSYAELRRRDRGLVADLQSATYSRVMRAAYMSKCYELANELATDVLEVYRGEEHQRAAVIQGLFMVQSLHPTGDFPLLPRLTILKMFRAFGPPQTGENIAIIKYLVRLIGSDSTPEPENMELMELICTHVVFHLSPCQAPTDAQSLGYRPPPIVSTSFNFVHQLLPYSPPLALNVFQVLVDNGYVIPNANDSTSSSINDFNTIIYSTLIKSSLRWGWKTSTHKLFVGLMNQENTPHNVKFDLAIEMVHSLLDTPNAADVRACGWLIRKAHRVGEVPKGLFRQFYSYAFQLNLGMEAEILYSFSREKDVLQKYHYPPPDGPVLTWLLEYFATDGRKVHLVRQLAEEVVEDNLSLPPQSRARFIAVTASRGHSRLARELWERYSVGIDRHVVVGDPALMIRMTSLFYNLATRLDLFIERSQKGEPSRPQLFDESKRREQLADMYSFLDIVMAEYRKYHEPLKYAPHQMLTSLARACFIVGKFAEGFQMFRYLLDRKEVPDLHDVNVALTAMAEQHPRSAAKLINQMSKKGLQPDAVSYGTVIHYALLRKDMTLASDMAAHMKGLKDKQLSLKSLAMLIRAITPNDPKEDFVDQRERLSSILQLLKTMTDTNFIPSPQVGRDLVSASLRARGPVLAYNFWKLLLKDSTEWDDGRQQTLRQSIADMVLKDHGRGLLSRYETRDMLGKLKLLNRASSSQIK